MEAESTPLTSVNLYQATRLNYPEVFYKLIFLLIFDIITSFMLHKIFYCLMLKMGNLVTNRYICCFTHDICNVTTFNHVFVFAVN
jgi:hypothetical protein